MSLTQHDSETDKMSFIEEQMQEQFCSMPVVPIRRRT